MLTVDEWKQTDTSIKRMNKGEGRRGDAQKGTFTSGLATATRYGTVRTVVLE